MSAQTLRPQHTNEELQDNEEDSTDVEASPSRPVKPTKSSQKDRYMVATVFIVFVIMRALDRVFLYRVTKVMQPYAATLMSLYWPPMVQFMCFLVCLGHVFIKRFIEGDKRYGLSWFSPCSPMASEQCPVPITWLAQFFFWDQLNAMISAPPSPFIPLVLQTPLNNTVVLWTAIIAYFYLKTRFQMVHYAGIILIILSCLTGVLVELQGPPDIVCAGLRTADSVLDAIPAGVAANLTNATKAQVAQASANCVRGLPPYKDSHGQVIYIAFGTLTVMYLLYVVAIIPTAFVNCYKQKKLKQVNLDIMWSFFWAGMWQVLWGLLMFPLTWVPWPEPGGHNTKSASTFRQDLADSWTCFLGSNPSPEVTTCSAEPAWAWFMMYLLFNVFFNLLYLWLIKRLSGTWASIGSILCGNLCGIFSQYRLFAGDSATALTLEQWEALAIASVAMWVYNIEEEVDVDGRTVYGDKKGGDHRYDEHGRMGLDPDSDASSGDEPDASSHTLM